MVNEDIEYYRFSFDQMNDYCAKAICIFTIKWMIVGTISTHVLKIENEY